MHRRLSTTTVYVTHDQVEAMTVADRIVVVQDGRVEQVGAPLELYDRPANLFVATFIGSPAMNLLQERITRGGFVMREDLTLPLSSAPAGAQGEAGVASAGAEGEAAVYGIRPEHFALSAQAQGGQPIEVVVVEPTGSETQVVASLAGQSLTAVFRERIHTRLGETLHIVQSPDRVHLFDADNGPRIN